MRILNTVVGAIALLSPCVAQTGNDFVDEVKVVPTTLTQIRATPESYKGVWVSFPVQFSAVGRLQNPFFTRFVASDYANFHVWADEQPIWRKEEFDDIFGLMFVSKDAEQLQDTVNLGPYDRIMVTGIVRNTFQGLPWIEMTTFERLEGKVDAATLSHLFRGEEHMNQRAWTRAISELSMAPVEGVPLHIKAAVHKNLGFCFLRLGEPNNALTHLQAAAELYGTTDPETSRWIGMAERDPTAGLDREVDTQAVKDFDRPLWEAFAPVSGSRAAPQPTRGN